MDSLMDKWMIGQMAFFVHYVFPFNIIIFNTFIMTSIEYQLNRCDNTLYVSCKLEHGIINSRVESFVVLDEWTRYSTIDL